MFELLVQKSQKFIGIEGIVIVDHMDVETDHPRRPFWLHGSSRSRASYMLQIISRTNKNIMDLLIVSYTLSLYGNMLIISIIVLSSMMHAIVLFFCSVLLCPIAV